MTAVRSAVSPAVLPATRGVFGFSGLSLAEAIRRALFGNNEQGVFFDPSDFSTMFQDSAGTTPVTATGQTVGKILDKSGKGNHATQANLASRPILGRHPVTGLRNLLLATDTMATQNATVTAVAHTLSFTGTGTVTLSGVSTAGPLVGTGAGNRVSLTFTPTAGSLTMTVSGSVTFAQLEIGSTATAYQKVVAATEVTEAGVESAYYLKFDGSDDFLQTAAIDFSATDEMSVFAGLYKPNDVALVVVELSANANLSANPGAFYLVTDATYYWAVGAKGDTGGTLVAGNTGKAGAASGADTAVLSSMTDISGDVTSIRRNGVAGTSGTADKGTGNFGATYPLYIGRRAGTSLPFNGYLYSLIARGKVSSAEEIAQAEAFIAGKTGVTLP